MRLEYDGERQCFFLKMAKSNYIDKYINLKVTLQVYSIQRHSLKKGILAVVKEQIQYNSAVQLRNNA